MPDTNQITSHGGWRAATLGAVGALLVLGLVACTDGGAEDIDDTGGDRVPTASVVADEPEDQGTPVPHVTVEAEILNSASEDIEINAGDSVTWTNSDDEARTISGEGFEDTTVDPGETFTHTFTEEGTYEVDIEGGETFSVTVLTGLQPSAQGTGVPRPVEGTPTSGN